MMVRRRGRVWFRAGTRYLTTRLVLFTAGQRAKGAVPIVPVPVPVDPSPRIDADKRAMLLDELQGRLHGLATATSRQTFHAGQGPHFAQEVHEEHKDRADAAASEQAGLPHAQSGVSLSSEGRKEPPKPQDRLAAAQLPEGSRDTDTSTDTAEQSVAETGGDDDQQALDAPSPQAQVVRHARRGVDDKKISAPHGFALLVPRSYAAASCACCLQITACDGGWLDWSHIHTSTPQYWCSFACPASCWPWIRRCWIQTRRCNGVW